MPGDESTTMAVTVLPCAPLCSTWTRAVPVTPHGTIAFTWASCVYVSCAATPLMRTFVPASKVLMLPATPVRGPSPDPNMLMNSLGAMPAGCNVAAFTTPLALIRGTDPAGEPRTAKAGCAVGTQLPWLTLLMPPARPRLLLNHQSIESSAKPSAITQYVCPE